MTAEALFLYGTLQHPPVYSAIAGEGLAGTRAVLADHAVTYAMTREGATLDFPLFTPRPGARAAGLIVRPGAEARARLDLYERLFGYDPVDVTVASATGPVAAQIYLPRADLWLAGPDWSLDRWAEARGDLAAETAAEVMALAWVEGLDPARLVMRYPMLSAHVASRRRARAQPAPASLRRPPAPGDVELVSRSLPYARFFGVEEQQVRFRGFDGQMSAPVLRATFVMADAVTLLPWDPVRDTVLLVEQFRIGPRLRGDPNPWTLEAIAGRIDPGETPEQAARREAVEEAQLTLGALHDCGRYYPSPGAVSEFLFTFVGIADLPDSAAGLHGLASEGEDIRTHVVPLGRLLTLIASGEVANGPLIASAYWLALNRERLAAGA